MAAARTDHQTPSHFQDADFVHGKHRKTRKGHFPQASFFLSSSAASSVIANPRDSASPFPNSTPESRAGESPTPEAPVVFRKPPSLLSKPPMETTKPPIKSPKPPALSELPPVEIPKQSHFPLQSPPKSATGVPPVPPPHRRDAHVTFLRPHKPASSIHPSTFNHQHYTHHEPQRLRP